MTLRNSEDTQHDITSETEVKGAGEKDDEMTEAKGGGVVGEEDMEPPGWRARAGPGSKPTQKERERRARSNTCIIP